MRRRLAALCCLLLAAGCASYEGRGLVPGQSTESDVLAVMGTPKERRAGAAPGETVLWFSRQPYGPQNYAALIAADGRLTAIEPRLTEENVGKLERNKTTEEQVHDLFGPPYRIDQNPRMQREVWTYKMPAVQEWKVLFAQFSPDRILREYYYMDDPEVPKLPAGRFHR
jgi:hypothetical protein